MRNEVIPFSKGILGQRRDGTGANSRALENDAVVNEANVLVRVLSLGALLAEQIQHFGQKRGELAVLNELAQMAQSY